MTETQQTDKRLWQIAQLIRLDKPVGTWLLLWPCWWSLALASGGMPDAVVMAWFALGAFCMRSAGCVVNDLADRRFDAQVARTRSRPLASGALTPYDALCVLALLLAVSLLVVMQLHPNLLWWSIGSLVLVGSYPFMKRITYWPQAFLGLTFNLGALFGWVAVEGGIALPAMLLYAAGICWTLGYDTIYAHQDTEDDIRIGVKSTALRFGARTRPIVALFYALMVLLLAAIGLVLGLNWGYFAVLCLVAAHLFWQIATLNIHHGANCLARFRSNLWLGLLIYIAVIVG